MRRLLGASMVFAAWLIAADVDGRWKGKLVTSDGYSPILLFLKQDGGVLKGTGGPDGLNQSPLENGKVSGDKLVFDITPGRSATLHFELTASGADLNGTAKVRRNGQVVISTVTLRKSAN